MKKYNDTAVAVTNIGKDLVFKYCLKSPEYFCSKYNCALEIIENVRYGIRGQDDYNYLTFEKNQIYELFDTYDRILRVDTDILITPTCPNVFTIVPQDKIGVVYEDIGSRKAHRRKQILNVQNALGDIKWRTGYFNSGVVLVSKEHKELFKITDKDIHIIINKLSGAKEQNLLNYRVKKFDYEIHELDFRFNHTRIFSESWNGSQDRLDSYIIHYAGHQKSKQRMIRKDYKKLFHKY